MSKALKEKYNNKCQLCGRQLRNADGNFMSEAHHIQPYNKFHRGSDSSKNLIILCPNHHAQFDQLFYAIEPQTHVVHCLYEEDQYHYKFLEMVDGHEFGEKHLEYIWHLFCDRKRKVNKSSVSYRSVGRCAPARAGPTRPRGCAGYR